MMDLIYIPENWTDHWWNWGRIGLWQGLVSALAVGVFLRIRRGRVSVQVRYWLLVFLLLKLSLPPIPGWGLFPWLGRERLTHEIAMEPPNIGIATLPAKFSDFEYSEVEFFGTERRLLRNEIIDTPLLPTDQSQQGMSNSRPARAEFPWKRVGMLVHLTGAVALMVMTIGRYRWFLYRLDRHGQQLTSREWTQALAQLKDRLRITGAIELWTAPYIDTPAVVGVLRPRILLPGWTLDASRERRLSILGHELAHVQRRDTLAVWIEIMLVGLQWWNPLVHYVRRLIQRDREWLCDALALRVAKCDRQVYAETLVDALAHASVHRQLRFGTEMNENRKWFSDRLEAVMSDHVHRDARLGIYKIVGIALVAIALLPGVPIEKRMHAMDDIVETERARHERPDEETSGEESRLGTANSNDDGDSEITKDDPSGQAGFVDVAFDPQPVMLLTLDISRDGSHILVGGNYGYWVYRIDSNGMELAQRGSEGVAVRKVAFSPTDSNLFVTWCDDNVLRTWRLEQETPEWEVTVDKGYVFDLGFSPDGKLLLLSGYELQDSAIYTGHVTVLDAQAGTVEKEFRYENQAVCSATFSQDGKLLAVAKQLRNASTIIVYDRDDWAERQVIEVEDGFPNVVRFLNDANDILIAGGKYFGNQATPQREGRIWVAKAQGGEYAMELMYEGGEESYRAFDPSVDGLNIALGSTEERIDFGLDGQPIGGRLVTIVEFRSAISGELRWLAESKLGEPFGVRVSPNGAYVAFCSSDSVFLASTKDGAIGWQTAPAR